MFAASAAPPNVAAAMAAFDVMKDGAGKERLVGFTLLLLSLLAQGAARKYRAALALRAVTEDDEALRPPRRLVYSLTIRELEQGPPSSAMVDHVFALLSLCTPRQSVELVRQGLASENKKLRGIALEYLESLLPDAVRVELVPRLDPAASPRPD
jgi:hypothetical protein